MKVTVVIIMVMTIIVIGICIFYYHLRNIAKQEFAKASPGDTLMYINSRLETYRWSIESNLVFTCVGKLKDVEYLWKVDQSIFADGPSVRYISK